MRPGGIILCEHQRGEQLPETVVDFALKKQYNYGKITVSAYKAAADKERQADVE